MGSEYLENRSCVRDDVIVLCTILFVRTVFAYLSLHEATWEAHHSFFFFFCGVNLIKFLLNRVTFNFIMFGSFQKKTDRCINQILLITWNFSMLWIRIMPCLFNYILLHITKGNHKTTWDQYLWQPIHQHNLRLRWDGYRSFNIYIVDEMKWLIDLSVSFLWGDCEPK